jgi:hypothetical protein
MSLDRLVIVRTVLDTSRGRSRTIDDEKTVDQSRGTNLQNACLSAAQEIIRALHDEGADFLLTDEEIADIIYRKVNKRVTA